MKNYPYGMDHLPFMSCNNCGVLIAHDEWDECPECGGRVCTNCSVCNECGLYVVDYYEWDEWDEDNQEKDIPGMEVAKIHLKDPISTLSFIDISTMGCVTPLSIIDNVCNADLTNINHKVFNGITIKDCMDLYLKEVVPKGM